VASTDPEVTLTVNGVKHEGWKSVTVRSSIEEIAQSFTVEYSQRWSASGDPVAIDQDDDVVIRFGDTLVLTGIVDRANESYDATSHDVSVQGRARTGYYLVSGSAEYKSGAIKGKRLDQLAALLCEPFGISVSLSEPGLDVGGPADVQIQDGQSAFEILNERARAEGVLLLTDPAGNLVLARAATALTPGVELRSGLNIKRGSLVRSGEDRFSKYVVKGQAPSGNDPLAAALGGSNNLKYEVTDDDVKHKRTMIFVDHDASMVRLKQRALWERNNRAGKALQLTYDVQGWLTPAGTLWQPNTLVPVTDDMLGISAQLLITSVDFNRTLGEGRTARIEVTPRETYDVLKPPKPPKRKKKNPLAAPL